MNILKRFLLIGVIALLVGCDNQLLLSNLSQRQSNEVLAILQAHGVDATRKHDNKSGDTIRVSSDNFVIAVDLLQKYNLPSKEPVEIIQAFPGDSLVASPQAERTRLLSLIEQRLEQSLLSIPDVVNARVHVSYPLNGNGTVKPIQKVSSLVTYSGNEDPKMMMSKIKLFLNSSFSETTYDNVSVVVINRPPLQYQLKSTSENSIQPILIGAIFVVIVFLFSLLALILKRQSNRKKSDDITEIKLDVITK